MGTAASKIKALHQSRILMAHARREIRRMISDAFEAKVKAVLFLPAINY